MSTDIHDYSIDELMDILNIQTLSKDVIVSSTQEFINSFKNSNPEMADFFSNIQDYLLEEIGEDSENTEEHKVPSSNNSTEWLRQQYLKQSIPQQNDKITSRENKIRIFDNDQLPMKREQLGITNNYQVKVGQDTLNPVLQNTMSRYIVIDSQYRQPTNESNKLNTDFTLDLSDHMVNVLSIRLTYIQVPYSWFNINSLRNTIQIYNKELDKDVYYTIQIDEGNYETIDDVITALNKSFVDSGFIKTGSFVYIKNGKVVIDLSNIY
jgi:hypothetical protein